MYYKWRPAGPRHPGDEVEARPEFDEIANPQFHSQDRRAAVIERVWWNRAGVELDFDKACR